MSQLVPLLILAAVCAWWWSSMRAREAAAQAAARACRTFDAQFLDETVALRGMRPRRDRNGRFCLRRVYRFEFSHTGGERHAGYATLLGRSVIDVHLDATDRDDTPARRNLH